MSAQAKAATWTRWTRFALIAVLLLGALAKWRFRPSIGEFHDGAYYFQIARHVAEGDGLLTSFSVFHQGLDPLPQPTITYPLWPLLLGTIGKIIGLERAATLVPECFYGLDLILAAVLVTRAARRLYPARAGDGRAEAIGVGAAALLATNPIFFTFTSRPYTEGLSLALLLGSLLVVDVASSRGEGTRSRGAWMAAAGVQAGFAYAARYQLLVAPFAIAFAIAVTHAKPSVGRRDALVFLASSLLPMAWVVARLVHVPGFTLALLVDHSAYRQTDVLPPFRFQVDKGSVIANAIDRLFGLGVAFDPTSVDSYFAQFGPVAYAPFVVAFALVLAADGRSALNGLAARIRSERFRLTLAAFALGIVVTLPIHLLHGARFREWAFGYRQGIFALFVFWPALGWLISRPTRGLRAAGVLLGVTGLAFTALSTRALEADPNPPLVVARREVGAWLDALPVAPSQLRARPRVTGMDLQPLAVYTRANLYWLACWSDPEVAKATVDRFAVEFMVLAPRELECPSLTTVRSRLREVRRFGAQNELGAYRIDP